MAKIRIYELARDLNLTNKDLLLKLKEMEISVASHMSSLDDDTVKQIKLHISGTKGSELEETRVKPTVIRRRKKASPAESKIEPVKAPAPPVEATETDTPEPAVDVSGDSLPLKDEPVSTKIPPEAAEMETVVVTETDTEVTDDTKRVKKKKTADSAKIITEAKPPAKKDEAVAKSTVAKKSVEVIDADESVVETEGEAKAGAAEKPKVKEDVAPDEEQAEAVKKEKTAEKAKKNEATKVSRLKKRDDVAKIVKKAPVEPKEIVKPETIPEEPVHEELIQATVEPEPKRPQKKSKPSKKELAQETKAAKAESTEKVTDATKRPSAAEPVTVKKQKPAAKSRKVKKEMPAKIISLPKRPVRTGDLRVERGGGDAEKQIAANSHLNRVNGIDSGLKKAPSDIDSNGRDKKKKGKRKAAVADESIQDKRVFKKKISFKKKEVIEGKDLYSGKAQRGRKGRKGVKARDVAPAQKTQITTAKAIKRRIKMDDAIVLAELAKRMGIKANEMIAKLMRMGIMATVNQTIDFETAVLAASEFDYEVEKASFEEETILKVEKEEDPSKLVQRPPVITIMGHVDHGKTSLLDVIRKSRVTEIEAGGITQHIGAYHVSTGKGQMVFLDTPGHEAFSAMRSRGAKVTDIVVLVVAADDGVMPQTIEAINHSKVADVPIIVAVNKMDKADADPARVQRELAEKGLVPEDWGGDTIFVNVSAKQNEGIDDLLEMILLQAEMLELKANPNKAAVGHVVEAKLDSGRGPVATILVQDGTLNTGDPVVCGVHYGKVRALLNDLGKQVKSAGPSIPAEIVGLSGVPMAGDELVSLEDEKDAKQISMHRTQKLRSKELAKTSRLSLEKLYEKMQQGEVKELNLIIKADVDGSIEAIRDSLLKLSNEEVSINVIHSATGTITESDISLAAVSDAIIIGFNVRPNAKVSDMANEENVDIRFHNIIYNVIKEIKDAIVGLMESTFEERVLGRAEVRKIFHVPKVGTIAGCYVTDGKIERGQLLRLLRDGIVTYEGRNSSLRRYKDDVKDVPSGYECGIGIENYNDIKMGDIIECYYLEEIRPEVE